MHKMMCKSTRLQSTVCSSWDLKWLVIEFSKQHPTNLHWQLRASFNPSKASHSPADKVSILPTSAISGSSAPLLSVFSVFEEVRVQTSHCLSQEGLCEQGRRVEGAGGGREAGLVFKWSPPGKLPARVSGPRVRARGRGHSIKRLEGPDST